MATLGNAPNTIGATVGTDYEAFNGNGVLTTFTLKRAVTSSTDIEVVVENVKQQPTVGFTASGTTLTLTGAAPVGTGNVYVIYSGSTISTTNVPPLSSVTPAMLSVGAPSWDATGNVSFVPTGIVTVGPSFTGPNTKMAIRGGSAASGTTGSSLVLCAPGTAQGQNAALTFYSSFSNVPGDNGPRRTADIHAGYENGAWGTEYISFAPGQTGGAANDTNLLNATRFTVRNNGTHSFFGKDNCAVYAAASNGWGGFYAQSSGVQNSYVFFGNAGGEKGRIYVTDVGDMWFGNTTGGNVRMGITGVGGVLIGTTSPYMGNVSGRLQLAAESAQLAMRSTSTAAGQFWYLGPDPNNNTTLYNQAGQGVYVTNGGTTWSGNSDIRIKKNVEVVEDGLDKVMNIRPIKYNWKSEEDGAAKTYGVVAQDVLAVAPEITTIKFHEDHGFDVLGVKHTELIPLLIASIQELKRDFDEYKRTHP